MSESLAMLDGAPIEAAEAEGDGVARADVASSSMVKNARITKGMLRRRKLAIRGYVGANGSGKTALAVRDLLPSIYAGRKILSTVPIVDHRTGELYEHYTRFDSWSHLLDDSYRHADVLMDEITGIANARASQSMPIQVQAMLDKLRKRDLTLIWTAPAWQRADTTIRSTSWGVTLCRSYLPTFGESHAAWRPRRLFRARTFDVLGFEDFNKQRAEGNTVRSAAMKPGVVEWWWGPGSPAFGSYDSMDPVSRVGEVLDSGRCAHCGGTRPAPKCSCDDTPHRHTIAAPTPLDVMSRLA